MIAAPSPPLGEVVEPQESRRVRAGDVIRWGISAAILVVLIAAWSFLADHYVKPIWISSPSLVWHRFTAAAQDGSLWRNTAATTEEAALGLIIGTAAGVAAGIALAKVASVGKVLEPYIVGAYSLPRVALAPFFVLWFGIGLESKVVLVVSIVFFVVLFNVRQGMQSIDPDLRDALSSMKASGWEMLRYVTIPSLVPWVISSVRICIAMSLIGAVVGELVGATKGLGWAMETAINNFDTTGAVLDLLVMAVIAMVFYYLMTLVERRVLRWRPTAASTTVPM